MKQQLSLTSCG